MNDFAESLGLKESDEHNAKEDIEFVPLTFGPVKNELSPCFGYGDEPECWFNIDPESFSHVPRLQQLVEELRWRESIGESAENNTRWFVSIMEETVAEAKKSGLIKGTSEWNLRWSTK